MGLFDLIFGRRSSARETATAFEPLNLQKAKKLLEDGKLEEQQGRGEGALKCYDEAIALMPELAHAHFYRGTLLLENGDASGALSAFQEAIKLQPNSKSAYYNMGHAHFQMKAFDKSIVAYEQALGIDPEFAVAHVALGLSFEEIDQTEHAVSCYNKALEHSPNNAKIYANLGSALSKLCRIDDAIANFRHALRCDPNFTEAYSNLLLVLNFLADKPAADAFIEAKRYGELVERRARPYTQWKVIAEPARRLRIGLVSGDLRAHPVGYFIESPLAALKSSFTDRLEIFVYYNHASSDAVTERIQHYSHAWRLVSGLTAENIAQTIHDDAIDILIDLTGHTANNLLPVFAWKPAPVQVSWLGYFATTGVSAIDYVIADPWTLPRHCDKFFVEHIWRLPETRLCFTPPYPEIPVSPSPAIVNGYVTFGCLSNLVKLNSSVVFLWSRILSSVPGSRLFLMAPQLSEPNARQVVLDRFKEHGVSQERLELQGAMARVEYLGQYKHVDIVLDTFPYTGGTTTAEALWMGVPVLTMNGNSLLACQGVGIMMNAGLPDWVAVDADDYLAKAASHAHDLPSLAALRAKLRQQILRSPIFDAPQFAVDFEAALRGMWQQWCNKTLAFQDDAHALFDEGVELEAAGAMDEALHRYDAAISCSPSMARAHFRRGNILLDRGANAEALEAYTLAAKFKPDSAGTHYNMGNALLRLGSLEFGIAALERAIAIRPDFAEAHHALGVALLDKRLPAQAVVSFNTVLNLEPDNVDALHKRGIAFQDLQEPAKAATDFERALALSSGAADIHSNLGSALVELNRLDDAIASYTRALHINPKLVDVHYNLGLAHQNSGNLERAIESYHQALGIEPDHVSSLNNLGGIFVDLGRNESALQCFRHVCSLEPKKPDVHLNLGIALVTMGQTDAAMQSFRQALAIQPDSVDAMLRLGGALIDIGEFQDALKFIRDALALKPDYPLAHNLLLFVNNFIGEQPPEMAFEDAKRFGALVQSAAIPYAHWATCPDSTKKLQIGLVSGDLCNHPVGYFIDGVLNALVRIATDRLEVSVYLTRQCNDKTTERIKRCCTRWRPVGKLSDAALARQIHDDGIDILIDLSGHTAHNRLPMFAWRPAPVQVSWLGYFATTGVPSVDYLIADDWTLLPAQELFFTEEIWRLPETRLCFTAPDVDAQVGPLPAATSGLITFGCFNNLSKMNDAVVELWSRVLTAVPDSRLFLKSKQLANASALRQTTERFAVHGVHASRLILEGSQPRDEFLEAYRRVDIALDPFPYTGGTTTAEALWMGVPVLTLAGENFLSRQGVGLLMNSGLKNWVAQDADDYVAKAVLHASDLTLLASLRTELRQQVLSSPIFDATTFANHFNKMLRDMWSRWCTSQSPTIL